MDIMSKKRVLRSLNMGDIVSCTNGEQYEFVRMKQSKFIGRLNGVNYDIPAEMFVKVINRNEETPFDVSALKEGQLFYILNNKKEPIVFRFKYMINANRVMAENPVLETGVRVPVDMVAGSVEDL